MAIEHDPTAVRYLRAIFGEGIAAELTDRELLERFAGRAGEASELAFAALVARHGPMVLNACRAALGDEHDAQDAFQAVFLVLVHKARSLWVQDSIGPWLHAVALRVAAGARASASLRRTHERRRFETEPRSVGDPGGVDDELKAALHEEVGRLPEAYRTAIVLCDLEGLTHEEAARRLGWPIGTVKSRQGRGRERLRGRLIRRGLAPASGTIAASLAAERAGAAVPASLVDATVKVAALVSGGQAAAGAISATAAGLMRGAIRAMLLARLRLAAGMILLLGAVVTTAGLAIHSGAAVEQPPPRKPGAAAGTTAKAPSSRPALDALRAEDIPPEKRLAGLPDSTVAVLGEVRGRHAGEVKGLALSADGKLLATVSDQDMRVRLWDAETLLPIGSLAGHRGFVNCVAISPDGRWLASGGAFGDFFLWDMSVTPPKGTILLPTHGKDGKFNNMLRASAFSPDGRTLAVAGDAGGFELFDMSANPPASRGVLPGLDQQTHSLAFSPDGKTLALTGLEDRSIRLCDVTGTAPREAASLTLPEFEWGAAVPMASRFGGGGLEGAVIVLRGHSPDLKMEKRPIPALSAAFSPDGSMLAALDRNGHVWRWDLAGEHPTLRGQIPSGEDRAKVRYNLGGEAMITFSHDGRTLAAAQPDGSIRLWDREGADHTQRAKFVAHLGDAVTGVLAFRPDDRTLITGGGDHLVRAWDLSEARPAERFRPEGPIGGLNGIAFSADGARLAVADMECVRLWDLADARGLSRRPSPTTSVPRYSKFSLPLAFSPDGKTLYAGGDPWDVGGDKPRHLTDNSLLWGAMPHTLSLSADGRTMAMGVVNKVRVWQVKDREPVGWLTLDGDDQWAPAAALSPDGAHLAFAGAEHSVRLWVLAGLEPRQRAEINGNGWPISSLAFSLDGKVLAAGTNGGTRLWDISGRWPRELFPTRNLLGVSTARPINDCLGFSMAFTPDGKRLIAADQIVDKSGRQPSRPAICVYDVATGERLHEWDIPVPCWSIALAPDGRHVAAARRDGITLILRLPGPAANRDR